MSDYLKGPLKIGEHLNLLYLGAAGWVIVDTTSKELILVDPWPSFDLGEKRDDESLKRIKKLAQWIRKQINQNYKFPAILVGHEHTDHIGDIPLLVAYLSDSTEPSNTPPLSHESLPKVICDAGSRELLSKNEIVDLVFCEIFEGSLKLHYADEAAYHLEHSHTPGYPLHAGQRLSPINIGSFNITPFIWDHANISFANGRVGIGSLSGNYQRTSAFLVERAADTNTSHKKSLFIVGSAGEMTKKRTGCEVIDTEITTDVLLQAMPVKTMPTVFSYKDTLSSMVNYQIGNIKVRDRIVASHFEDFFGNIDGPGENLKNREFVDHYEESLSREAHKKGMQAPPVTIMSRFCFELEPDEINFS